MAKEEYKSIECISNMTEEYRNAFFPIVEAYREQLSERLVLGDSAYTPHDFDHHCFDIYKIISEILLENDKAFIHPYGLDPRELFILNLAVLFHDIGMFVIGSTRETHSVQSAEFIEKEFEDTNSALSKGADLSINEKKALKEIVKAHSDVKDGTVPPEQNGLKSPGLKNYKMKAGSRTVVRTRFLAGVLRVADEMDVTSDRLGGRRLESEISDSRGKIEEYKKKGEQEKAEKWKKYLESLVHWRRLHYFSDITKDKKTIVLHVDDEEIEKSLEASQSIESLAREVIGVLENVANRIDDANNEAFSDGSVSKLISLGDVTYETENDELKQAIETDLNFRKKKGISSKSEEIVEGSIDASEIGGGTDVVKEIGKTNVADQFPSVLNNEIAEMLSRETKGRELIQFGHYRLNERYCARDWLDTRELVETKAILNQIVNVFVKELNHSDKDYIIVGVDLVGALVAARVAFALQRPFTYLVSKKNRVFNANKEIEVSTLLEQKDVVLITDVIVSYETIDEIIDHYSIDKKRLHILSLFFRPSKEYVSNAEYVASTKSLNNAFAIELFEKDKCVYSSDGCLALNRRNTQEITESLCDGKLNAETKN